MSTQKRARAHVSLARQASAETRLELALSQYKDARVGHVDETPRSIVSVAHLRQRVPERLMSIAEEKILLVEILCQTALLSGLEAVTTQTPGLAEMSEDPSLVTALLALFKSPLTFDFDDARWASVLRPAAVDAEAGMCQFYSRAQYFPSGTEATLKLSEFSQNNPHQLHWSVPMEEQLAALGSSGCHMLYHGYTTEVGPVDRMVNDQATVLESKLGNWLKLGTRFATYEWIALRQRSDGPCDIHTVERLGNIERFLIALGGGTQLSLNSALGGIKAPVFRCSESDLASFAAIKRWRDVV